MSPEESLFLGLVIVVLATIAGVLAVVSWGERLWAKKNGK